MNKKIESLLNDKPREIRNLFTEVEGILSGCMEGDVEVKLWSKMPSYYRGENFVRIIPFNDHIN